MLRNFFLIGLPYIALAVAIGASIYRYRTNRFSYSSLSSQFLESKRLLWGSMPWHIGIIIVLLGHLIPLLAPSLWQSLTAHTGFLLTVEIMGLIAAVLSIIGLAVLLYRRVLSSKVQSVTSLADLLVLGLLLAQVLVGFTIATHYRWGAAWSSGTTTPYLWSILTFQPKPELVAGLPAVLQIHLVGAWLILLVLPFTRLVHLFVVPIAYLWRPPQKVVWATRARLVRMSEAARVQEETRRYFLRGAMGVAGAGILLSAGVMDKLARFFQGPDMSLPEEAALLKKKLERLEMAAAERELEIERMNSETILIGRLGELQPDNGTYFIDYLMRPALAFRDENGLPLLISAKCTHLGCTVSSKLDASRRLLCPCHMSFFDLHTGEPNAGSPAKAPLPHIGWVLKNDAGEIVAAKSPQGEITGELSGNLDNLQVYIAKQQGEVA